MITRRRLMAGLLATPVLAACGGNDKPASAAGTKATFLTAYGTTPRETYAWVGLAKGFFTEAGIDLTVLPGQPSLCRSLILRPRALLLDEPFSALDAITRTELAGELQRIHMVEGTTMVLVTHSIEEAVLLADRVVVLTPRPGRIRRVLDIAITRPRAIDSPAYQRQAAPLAAQLHHLLLTGRVP
jgi:hypothetical protein